MISSQAAAGWWHTLQPDPATGRPGDRAALARLRCCASVAEAMQEPATMALFRRCGAAGPADLPRVALTAAVLAHVRADEPGSIARRLGPDDPDHLETARLKPLRFRRLMDATTPDERLLAFRRLVAIAGGSLNIGALADALLHWNEACRQRWVYDYWNAGTPAAAEETTV
jgi:CRISPR system Cascade subunit CasB